MFLSPREQGTWKVGRENAQWIRTGEKFHLPCGCEEFIANIALIPYSIADTVGHK